MGVSGYPLIADWVWSASWRSTNIDGVDISQALRQQEGVISRRQALDEGLACCAKSDVEAIAVLADACQSRRTTARRLLRILDARQRVRRRRWMRAVLVDIAEGTCSVLEHGYLNRVEQAHGLPRATRQKRSTSSVGVCYRDTEYGSLVSNLTAAYSRLSVCKKQGFRARSRQRGRWPVDRPTLLLPGFRPVVPHSREDRAGDAAARDRRCRPRLRAEMRVRLPRSGGLTRARPQRRGLHGDRNPRPRWSTARA